MKCRGFTLIEFLIVIALAGILASVAIPYLVAARMASREAAAIGALVAINDAQAAYRETCGRGRYASSLPALGAPMPSTGSAFLSPDLTSGAQLVKAGYVFAMAGTMPDEPHPDCNGTETVEGYVVIADPVYPGRTGRRYFATNASRVIYEHTEPFAGQIPETGAPSVGTELRP